MSTPAIRVNYSISHRLHGQHFLNRNGTIRIKGEWQEGATQEKIKHIIAHRHPGWNITGWALAKLHHKGGNL